MKIFKSGLFLAALMALLACAHKTPVTEGPAENFCNFKRYHLNLDHRNNIAEAGSDVQSLNGLLTEGFSPDSANPIPKGDMLFLSGGSLNGAFGAGVIKGWAGDDNRLPDFSVVTGVSTGAILSLAAFANAPDAAIDGYDVESESQAINAFVRRNKKGKLSNLSYLTALRKGALADIAPLKNTIYQTSSKHGVLQAIAKRGKENRYLFTGVVDVDTGEAVALDMTDMAIKIYDEFQRVRLSNPEFKFNPKETIAQLTKRAPRVGHYVDCFTSAVAASSSVPLAALPIAIDNRLYIDGGARFLVFGNAIGPVIDDKVMFNPETEDGDKTNPPIDVYMIINGDQQITAKCGKKDCPKNLNGYDYWNVNGARDDWNLLGLVERTVDVLKTQVGEFSEAEVRIDAFKELMKRDGYDPYNFAPLYGVSGAMSLQALTPSEQTRFQKSLENSFENYNLHALKIEPDTLEYQYTHENQTKTCKAWREYDEITGRNLQFHVNYMRCLIEAGKQAVKDEAWEN